jgi:UDP-N-acetyl-D-galactosamine dehydrogenase
MLGITFKENCPDVRNTKIVDVVAALQDYGLQVDIYDPWASAAEVKHEYQLNLIHEPLKGAYDGIVLGVAHQDFKTLDLNQFKAANTVVYDVKGVLNEDAIDARL